MNSGNPTVRSVKSDSKTELVEEVVFQSQICQNCHQPFRYVATELYEGLCYACAAWEQEAFFLDWNHSSNYAM
jgi:hypothetical protein